MADSTLDKILDAATEVFAREGFAGAKVEEIARTAKVNKAALYYHVGNKEQLYERVLVDNLSRAASSLEQSIMRAENARQGLELLVNGLAEFFMATPLMPRIMVQEIARGGDRLSLRVLEQVLRIVRCTARVSGMAADEGGPRINSLALHVMLIATLAVSSLSGPLRERAALMPGVLGLVGPGVDQDIAGFRKGMIGQLKTALSAVLFGGDDNA